jgi:hypothetical protein
MNARHLRKVLAEYESHFNHTLDRPSSGRTATTSRGRPPGPDRGLDLPVQRDRRIVVQHDVNAGIGPGFIHRTGS